MYVGTYDLHRSAQVYMHNIIAQNSSCISVHPWVSRQLVGFSCEFAHGTGAVPTKAEPDESAQSPTIPKPSATMG